jgi:AraC-like DNA-binding protein
MSPVLRRYISRLDEGGAAQVYKVLPDTSIVMGFQFRGKLSYLEEGAIVPLASSGVTGLLDAPRQFQTTPGTGSVLVYFKPGRAAPFFNVPLQELHELSLGIDQVWPASIVRELEERLGAAPDTSTRIRLVEAFLLSRLRHQAPDPLVSEALAALSAARGQVRIGDLARQLHTSPSPLEKRFRREVGATPKQFASLLRFRAILELCNLQPNLTAAAYEAGYFDQAHFIRDFKTFTGETPAKFFTK